MKKMLFGKKALAGVLAVLMLLAILAACGGGSGGGAATTQAAATTTAAATTAAATTEAAKEAETTQAETKKDETTTTAATTKAEAKKEETTTAAAEEKTEGASDAAPVSGDGMEWRNKTDPVSFTCFIDGTVNAWDGWGTDLISQEITKRTGVTCEVKQASTTQHEELNAMLASGTLPDFIKCWEPNLRATLWKQGFLYPLNELIDQYCPNMWGIVPKDMDKIYTESDGNWYYMASYYSDVDRIAATPGVIQAGSGMTINIPAYEKLGEPSLETLDDYKDVMMRAKEEMGSQFTYFIYDHNHGSPENTGSNMAQLINRVYGGNPLKAVDGNGNVHLNFRDEEYRKAILYINDLYRSGLVNREMFTIVNNELFDPLIKNQQIFSFWGWMFNSYRFDTTADGPYQAVEVPKAPGATPHWASAIARVGGPDCAITSNCKNPERAILYFEFLTSDEGQLLTYHGREGIDYEMVDGMPKNLPEKAELWKQNFADMQKNIGILNYGVAWFPSDWVDQMYYYWLNIDAPAYARAASFNNKYARNERMNDLIMVESDSTAKVIETQIFDLWKNQLPLMYLADSEAECVAAYDDLITKAETLGLVQLEKEYTKIHADWLQRLN